MVLIRMLCAVLVMAIGAANAQQDPIAARKSLMTENGDQAKIGAAMAKGEAPFDLAKAHKIFATFQDAAAKGPALFQENLIDQATMIHILPVRTSGRVWTTSKQGLLNLGLMRRPLKQA